MDTTWDVIVIGGGAAGLSAALVLGRARRRTLLLDAGGQSNLAAHGIGGLLGQDGRPAPDFYADGRAELRKYPSVEVRDQLAGGARPLEGRAGFALDLVGGDGEASETVTGRRLVLATGASYRTPDLPGLAERFGRSVFHCPFCHGWEVRDGALAVLDGGEFGPTRALLLRAWSDDVTLLTNGPSTLDAAALEQLRAAGVALDERVVAGFEGAGEELKLARFDDGDSRPITGLLVPVSLEQRGGLADALGAQRATEGHFAPGVLQVDPMGQTTVPGVWAVGDAATAAPSVAGAVESGGRAAAAIVHHITAELGVVPAAATV